MDCGPAAARAMLPPPRIWRAVHGRAMTDKFLRPAQAIGVAIALVGAALIVWARNIGLAPSPVLDQRLMSTVALWGLVLLLFAWTGAAEQRPIASIGFPRPSLGGAGWGLAVGVGLIVVLNLIDRFSPMPPQDQDPGGLLGLPLWMRVALVVTSAFTEEVIFRGYPITRLKELTGSTAIAAAVPFAAFVLLHAPTFGLAAETTVAISGAGLTALFLWRKDLWSNVIAHFAVNSAALVIQPLLEAAKG
jgi:membrane protease YdiL (CAAX protease family)